jgi:hypothetical protein
MRCEGKKMVCNRVVVFFLSNDFFFSYSVVPIRFNVLQYSSQQVIFHFMPDNKFACALSERFLMFFFFRCE